MTDSHAVRGAFVDHHLMNGGDWRYAHDFSDQHGVRGARLAAEQGAHLVVLGPQRLHLLRQLGQLQVALRQLIDLLEHGCAADDHPADPVRRHIGRLGEQDDGCQQNIDDAANRLQQAGTGIEDNEDQRNEAQAEQQVGAVGAASGE